MAVQATSQPVSLREKFLPGVRHIIAVASGKGGVGKSTVSANLALALARSGFKVGLLDADVYGPSIPMILGVKDKPVADGARIRPVERHGIRVISTGFFFPPEEAVVWRGPMLHKMVQDLLTVTDWGDLDYLLIDLPPGTGDVQISLCQTIALDGAVIVSTPQDVAWNVAQKAIAMFRKLGTPLLGVIENMGAHVCAHCGTREEIFGSGGARSAAERLNIPFLGDIPLETAVRRASDAGEPALLSAADSASSRAFLKVSAALAQELRHRKEKGSGSASPVRIGPMNQKTVEILWSDGRQTAQEARTLRLNCPCAGCVDELTGKRTLDPARVPQDVKAVEIYPVGSYAFQIRWSDGHDTGLYSYEFLRKLA